MAIEPGDTAQTDRVFQASMVRLRLHAAFFATLALFARVTITDQVPTAATDGRDIYWNREFLNKLKPDEIDGVMLHEVLHAALLHVPRRGNRNRILWNIAADIVVNGMIVEAATELNNPKAFALPKGAVRDKELEKFSVEEVYEILLQRHGEPLELMLEDLLDMPPGKEGDSDLEARRAELTAHWRAAQVQAQTLMRATGRGKLPTGFGRELANLEPAQVDWRSRLWRFLVRTPTDFSGFDRRFVGRGLYLEALEGESLHVYVAIDTSGSVGPGELGQFIGEVQGILRSYPHLTCDLYYVDAAAYGPYRLTANTDVSVIPRPVGGGGTDFRPFFKAIGKTVEEEATGLVMGHQNALAIYLTDGYGTFPEAPFVLPTLWVVTPGGLDLEQFPFGETVRLLIAA